MMYQKIADGEYEKIAENLYDAVLILGDAMSHASIYEDLYYELDWDWRFKNIIYHDSPVCLLNRRLAQVVRELEESKTKESEAVYADTF